jgi:hypothetical protein
VQPHPPQGPWLWWADPLVAASAGDAPEVRRSRALLRAIAEECQRSRTKLCILVVGPVMYNGVVVYAAQDGRSPLGRIIAGWGIDAPVLDLAAAAAAAPHPERLLFDRDGHLNEAGHAFLAAQAIPALRDALAFPDRPASVALQDASPEHDGPVRRAQTFLLKDTLLQRDNGGQ